MAPGAARGRCVWDRPVGIVEAANGAVMQQNPRGREVARRITREEVIEVDHPAARAVGGEDIGRMTVDGPAIRIRPVGPKR